MKISLGTFALKEVKARFGADASVGVRAALDDFTRRLDAGPTPIGIPRLRREVAWPPPAASVEVEVEDEMWLALKREATRQGATVGELAAHSVLVYLADLDRMTPPSGARAA